MTKYKILTIVFCFVTVISLVCAGIAFFQKPDTPSDSPSPGVTIVRAADQTAVSRPMGFPDPEGNWIALPEGVNLAEGKTVKAGEITDIYAATNTVDGDTTSYWESKGVPAEITVDLAGSYTIQTVVVRLNPAAIWEARVQGISILISTDGENFTVAVPDERYEFNPDTGNIVRVDFTPVTTQYVKLVFSSNSAGRSGGAQAAEILIFE